MVSFLLFGVYLLGLIQPITPLIEYGLNKDYIQEILCINKDNKAMKCNGKCYLSQQMAAKNTQETNDETPSIDLEKRIIDFLPSVNEDEKSNSSLEWIQHQSEEDPFTPQYFYNNPTPPPNSLV